MIDCEIKDCYLYEDCFFKTVFVKKPNPKTGCSYYRKFKKKNSNVDYDEQGNKLRKTRADKGQKREKKVKKKKKEKRKNSLQEIL